jgi:predicted Zn-ribbon and HTH transcriptional regulator
MDAVIEDLYHQDKPADAATIAEMMDRMEEHNYFAPSVRHIYKTLLREEYRRFLERKTK